MRSSFQPLILHVFKTYLPDTFGGVERVIHEIAQGAACQGFAAEVFTLAANGGGETVNVGNHKVYRARTSLDVFSTPISTRAGSLFRRLASEADLVHYHFPWPMMDLWHLYSGGCAKPSVVTYHSDVVKQSGLLRFYQPLMCRFLASVDKIVATSPQYAQTSPVLSRYRDKTVIIPLGLDGDRSALPSADLLAYWRERLPKRFFLFVGLPRYYKGLEFLFRAARSSGLPVVIAGGAVRTDLAPANVHFVGKVSDADKSALLELAEAFVFPSHLRSEAFGLALLEAAFAGKPLISCEIGTGTSFVNRHGETGLVVPPADPQALAKAMQTLWQDPALRLRYGAAAKRRARTNFRSDQMVAAYYDLYRGLLAKEDHPRERARQAVSS